MKLTIFFLFIFIFIFTACSSVDGDAKKAADLNKESVKYVKDRDLKEAERAYKESLEIISRYKDTEHYEEFRAAYTTYMYGEALKD